MIAKADGSKTLMAKALGISRSAIYYRSKKLARDWELKTKIEEALSHDPSYGYRRIALKLGINKKRAQTRYEVIRCAGIP